METTRHLLRSLGFKRDLVRYCGQRGVHSVNFTLQSLYTLSIATEDSAEPTSPHTRMLCCISNVVHREIAVSPDVPLRSRRVATRAMIVKTASATTSGLISRKQAFAKRLVWP